ncbi:AraC family transcriptional regulator [Paenibacillus sinopodophylli]|uniref:AraC family transcriptional regulator n=1 Tax=Paenibacillus sinopodophylli TaxID=1837342 RepID=UPI00110D0FC3|nr:helix-turn-helix domain-containing protein [Paenibacillus sinopodophylli]
MPNDTEYMNYFTKEMIDPAVRLWARSSISLIDVRYQLLHKETPLQNYRMPTNMFVFTQGGEASIKLNSTSYQSGRFGIFHGGKGTELSIHPVSTNLETYMVLYKAETAPFYKRDIYRLLERINPFTQIYGFSPDNPIFFVEKFQNMYERWNLESALHQFNAKATLYQLVYEIYRELEEGNIHYFEPDYVELVKQYLDQHYTEQVSIQLLSETLPISRSLLGKLFRKREQKSLQEYLNERRLDAAKLYLQSANLSIQEVAVGCGFTDELNLNRMFKKYVHMTPSEYRRKMIDNFTKNDIDNDSQRLYNERGLDRLVNSKGDGEFNMFVQIKSKEMILVAAMSLMLLLSACSSNAPVNNTATQTAQSQNQEANNTESKGAEAVAQTRIVKTDTGDIEIPADPQRIVYLVGNNVGDILPFEKTVVGVDKYGDPSMRPEEWKQQWGQLVTEAKVVPSDDLEGIMALEPDLIIGSATWTSSSQEQLSKIAPTIFYNEMSTLEERMTFFGEVFGMPEQAKQFIAKYATKVEAAKQRLVDAGIYDKKIVFLQGVEEGSPGLQGDKTRGIIYEDLGMRAPEIIEKEFFNRENPKSEGFYSPISLEVVSKYLNEADIIAYSNFDPNVEELEKKLSSVEIWKTIRAVTGANITYYSTTDTLNDYDYASRLISLDTFVDALLQLPIAQK